VTPEEMHWAATFAQALATIKASADTDTNAVITSEESKALIRGIKLLRAGRPWQTTS
jgi:hypothetical protein